MVPRPLCVSPEAPFLISSLGYVTHITSFCQGCLPTGGGPQGLWGGPSPHGARMSTSTHIHSDPGEPWHLCPPEPCKWGLCPAQQCLFSGLPTQAAPAGLLGLDFLRDKFRLQSLCGPSSGLGVLKSDFPKITLIPAPWWCRAVTPPPLGEMETGGCGVTPALRLARNRKHKKPHCLPVTLVNL